MEGRDSIYLSIGEALEAVCIDFRRYDPQVVLLCQIIRLVSDGSVVVKREGWRSGAWIGVQGRPNMRWMEGTELVETACAAVKGADPDSGMVSSICARVFHTRAWEERDTKTGKMGVRIETGMEAFSCRQCGRCCTVLDYHNELTGEDVVRWEREGRTDILQWVRTIEGKDRERAYRIWTLPGTTRLAESCPFLKKIPSENRWECLIHHVKPAICRQYPLTRKHGLMTGCPGFDTKMG
ncbi:MAG: YkgJ family cysteine cluster protein [Deltaproteobacteria bacterium]|nr:YkgJ family cysteine cluster protein [Deltaproteobacteria bacterium]